MQRYFLPGLCKIPRFDSTWMPGSTNSHSSHKNMKAYYVEIPKKTLKQGATRIFKNTTTRDRHVGLQRNTSIVRPETPIGTQYRWYKVM